MTKLPGLLKMCGKKQVETATNWLGAATAYGATATIALFYFTDWKVVVTAIPFYNGKFRSEE